MKLLPTVAFAATLIALLSAPVAAQHADDRDWPCHQRKVPELSAASVWSGPAIDEAAKHWQEDGAIAVLVDQLASRRVPTEEATAALSKFAQGLKHEEKAAKLTLIFAGTFVSLNRERPDHGRLRPLCETAEGDGRADPPGPVAAERSQFRRHRPATGERPHIADSARIGALSPFAFIQA